MKHLFLILYLLLFYPVHASTPVANTKTATAKTTLRMAVQKVIEGIHKSHLNHVITGEVVKFYESRSFEPFWYVHKRWSVRAEHALSMIAQAGDEGLFVENYAQAQELTNTAVKSLQDKAAQEVLFCYIIFQYVLDLTGNRFSEKELHNHTAMAPIYKSPSDLFTEKLRMDDSCSWLKTLSIHIDEYQQLKVLLKTLRTKKDKSQDWPSLSQGTVLKLGAKEERVLQLKKILLAQGDYKGQLKDNTFDLTTESAVKAFQKRHGFTKSGIVDEPTRMALSVSLDERIRQVIINMERWRWLPAKMPERYVWVNIPSFELEGIQDEKTILTLPIIVGKFYTKTPVFHSEIYQIRFNPHWTVPHKIAVEHVIPTIQKDPDYFYSKDFVLLSADRTEEVDPESVDWNEFSKTNFPYVLRQKPGKDNALGRIRFSIKNPWAIYLHSTPDQKLFQKARRMFSSGCVRVKDPEKLADFVLNDRTRYPLSVILQMMNSDERKFVELNTKTPVYIVYLTTWVDNKTNYFLEDIYKKDKDLDALIHERESQQQVISLETLKQPYVAPPPREMSQEAAKEIFEPTTAVKP